METRQVTQVKLFKLILNRMTERTESGEIVAVAYDKDKLIEWYNSMKSTERIIELDDDRRWSKAFKIGSPLEWFNPCYDDFIPQIFYHGIHEEWVNEEVVNTITICPLIK